MRKIIKLISALVAVVLMVTTVSASGLNVESSFEDLSIDDIGFSENVQYVDEMTGSALISTEVGDGYTINTYSVNWTVTAGNSIIDTKQIYLATGDYIRVDLSFSPTPTGGVKIGGYNLSNGRFYYATKTSSTVSSNLRFSVSGAYLFEIENTSSFDIVVSGTYSTINFESSASLDVTHYMQEKTNWCWAACIQMCADYLGYYKTQTQIVTYVKGSDVDEGGGDEEYYKGMKYATNDV
ncbi:MAG: hypothetical protein LUH18_08440, partial [Oscillospiraceae bacterium]|nr:hypothetical protein [Oscillospiraceae bacterium]